MDEIFIKVKKSEYKDEQYLIFNYEGKRFIYCLGGDFIKVKGADDGKNFEVRRNDKQSYRE